MMGIISCGNEWEMWMNLCPREFSQHTVDSSELFWGHSLTRVHTQGTSSSTPHGLRAMSSLI